MEEITKKNQSEMKNTISKMKTLEAINSRLDEAENEISDSVDNSRKTQAQQQKNKKNFKI